MNATSPDMDPRIKELRMKDAVNAVVKSACHLNDIYLTSNHESLDMHAAFCVLSLKVRKLREVLNG